jgi:hypothetical protein
MFWQVAWLYNMPVWECLINNQKADKLIRPSVVAWREIIGPVWIVPLTSPTNIGTPKFWRTILPPTCYQCAGVESERLAWFPSFGADPNEAGGSSQRPIIWLGEWWLQSKHPHNPNLSTPQIWSTTVPISTYWWRAGRWRENLWACQRGTSGTLVAFLVGVKFSLSYLIQIGLNDGSWRWLHVHTLYTQLVQKHLVHSRIFD